MHDVTEAPEAGPRQQGRPSEVIRRETVSFHLLPKIAERLDDAYYQRNARLSNEKRLVRVSFREMVLEKGLNQIQDE